MASAAIRNSQAGPSCSRSESSRRGSICGSATRSAICQLDAPSVCALISCSRGSSCTFMTRSRMMQGSVPMTINAILEVSPSPMTMKRIGSNASGGTIDVTETNGPSSALAPGRMFTSRMAASRFEATLKPCSEFSLGRGVHVGGIKTQLHVGLVAQHRLVAKLDADRIDRFCPFAEQFLFEQELAHPVHGLAD